MKGVVEQLVVRQSVFRWDCPRCAKRIENQVKELVEYNSKRHMDWHIDVEERRARHMETRKDLRTRVKEVKDN